MENNTEKDVVDNNGKIKKYKLLKDKSDEGSTAKQQEENESNDPDNVSKKLRNYHEEEQQSEHIPYPKSVFFIIGNEFCERFCYYGMRTILSLYLTEILLYNETDAKVVYHTFSILVMFFPILGAIVSDGFLGKFNTIFYVSMIYAAGNILLSLSAADPVGLPKRSFSILSLLLIAIGTGGIKPCVSAFGGDQFVFPQQEKQFETYFSMFYFSINAGSFFSTFITPILREDVHCFGNDSCYPLAFAVPGILMIIAIVLFALGRPMYKIIKPERNVVLDFFGCIGTGIKGKITKKNVQTEHWLDHSKEKYGESFVRDVKSTLNVLLIFAPLPIFWSLYDQQGTAWTFQAVRMNGNIGFYTILPDQMQVVNPILILLFIPLFQYIVYPLFDKCHILKTPLQRMVCGGLLASLAFVLSAFVSLALEATYPVLPTAGNAQLRIYNTLNCNAILKTTIGSSRLTVNLPSMTYQKLETDVNDNISFIINSIEGCNQYEGKQNLQFTIKEEKAYGFYLTEKAFTQFDDDIDKDSNGFPRIRTLVSNVQNENVNITYLDGNKEKLSFPITNTSLYSISPGTYKVKGSDFTVSLELGGVYTAVIQMDNNNKPSTLKLFTITEPNTIHMLWLMPQIIVITAAEIMFSIIGLEFTYSQAPISMKSVLQAANLLTDSLGNVIIVFIEALKMFKLQSSEFFLYSALMFLDMIIFALLAMKYKYVNYNSMENDDNYPLKAIEPPLENGNTENSTTERRPIENGTVE